MVGRLTHLDDDSDGGVARGRGAKPHNETQPRSVEGWSPSALRLLGRRLRDGRTTSTATTVRCMDEIDRDNNRLHAFTQVTSESALRAADHADDEFRDGIDRGPLQGVPISLKDLIDVEGVRTSAASDVTVGHVAARDAIIVQRLRDQGAVIIGKANLHEFSFGTTNGDSAFGAALNPWDETRSPGGSSGGPAISVATGMAYGSVATDTGGGVRTPAAVCGIVGLKPTLGELPTDGVTPLSTTLDHVGVMARTVTDAFLLYSALKGTSTRGRLVRASLVGTRFGVLHRYFCDVIDGDVSRAFESILLELTRCKAITLERHVLHASLIAATAANLEAPEAYNYHALSLERSSDAYTASVRHRIEHGATIPASEYVAARQARDILTQEVDAIFEEVDVLVLPTLTIPPPLVGAEKIVVEGRLEAVRPLMMKMTQLFNITGHPAISIPCGFTSQGLPCGLQLVAPRGRTIRLLEIALAVEGVLRSMYDQHSRTA